MLPNWLWFLLIMVSVIGGGIAFIAFILYNLRPKELYVKGDKDKHGRWVKLKKEWLQPQGAPQKYEEQIHTLRRRRKQKAVITFLIAATAASCLLTLHVSGENGRQNREMAEQSMENTLVSWNYFAEPITREDVKALRSGGTVDFTIYTANGEPQTVEFFYDDNFFGTGLKPKDEALRTSSIRPGFSGGDRETQTAWKTIGEVYRDLEDTYGVFLTDEQRAALAVPAEEPEHLIRYGNTPLTTSLGDGTYFNGTVTLIWDGEYKLIGSEGTDQAAELTRK